MTPKTDIIIAVRGTREFPIEKDFEVCVDSVVQHTTNYRFVFVDDCSDGHAADVVSSVAAKFPDSILIRTHTQNWFTRAYNKGLRMVRTPRAIALNADTIVGERWLEELYECWAEAEAVSKVGLVGSVWSAEEGRRWAGTEQNRGYVTGHCWLLSMEAMAEASMSRGQPGWYLDETNPLNAHIRSDIEICWRLNGLGYQTLQCFKSYVMHLGGRSWGHQLARVQCLTQQDLARIDG